MFKSRQSAKFFFIMIILSALMLIWLTSHLWQIFPLTGQFAQYDPDSILFARLLEQSILRGEIVQYDMYGCFPYEIRHGFAPFYMWFLYNSTALYFQVFPDSQIDPMHVAGLLPIIFAWITGSIILLTAFKLSRSWIFLLFCGFFMLPACPSSFVSGFMRLDYDFLISFFIWGWLCCYLLILRSGKSFWQLVGATLTTLFIATWSGTPLFFFFVTLFGFIVWLRNTEDSSIYLDYAGSTMLVGAAVNLLLLRPTSLAGEMLSISKYSYFQMGCVLVGGLACFGLKQLQARKVSRVLGMGMMIFLSVAVALIFREQLMQATGFLFQTDPIHRSISELKSIFSPLKFMENNANIKDVMTYFGIGIVFLPVFFFARWNFFDESEERFLRFWVGLMLLMAFYQIRYIRWLFMGAGLYYAVVYAIVWRMIYREFSGRFKNIWLAAIFIPLLVAQINHNFQWISKLMTLSEPEVETYTWIRNNTPETSGYASEGKPEYGILSFWDEGNRLSYYARRPAVVNNAMWGYKTMAEIFSSKTEQAAVDLFTKYRIRYALVSTYNEYNLHTYQIWPAFKDMPDRPEYVLKYTDIPLDPDYRSNFYFWLIENLCLTARGGFTSSSHFRVVYAAKSPENVLSPYILFEKVAGAKIDIKADPGTTCQLSLEMRINGNTYLFKKSQEVSSSGQASFILPYTTSHKGGRVETEPFYKFAYFSDGKTIKATLAISEEDVVKGNDLTGRMEIKEEDLLPVTEKN